MDRLLQTVVVAGIESSQANKSSELIQHATIETKRVSSHVNNISISIPYEYITKLLDLTAKLFTAKPIDGFQRKNIPLDYLQLSLNEEITRKLRDLLIKHVAVNKLSKYLQTNKIVSCNYPRLTAINTPQNAPWSFDFDFSLAHKIELKEWRNFSFKQPKRKKYKDLDKQVINFLEQEAVSVKKLNQDIVEEQDWVNFEATLCDETGTIAQPRIVTNFWINVKQHAGVDVLRDLFINRRVGETFVTNLVDTDHAMNEYENYRYYFFVTIKSIVKGGHLSLDLFKGNFKLKNKMDIHNKLMEVFSFRNDESQRRSTIEEVFHLLLSKHRFEVPKHLVLRRQEDLLLSIMKQPDYHVYKAQKDFEHHLELLAEKQLKEEILVDQISHQENIYDDIIDAQHYFHLFSNKKLYEFIYFKPVVAPLDQFNMPFNLALLQQTFTREKTLNHIIHTMTN
ncbi:hypothetical protein FJ364_05490 [Candidatus Dependentiae bacterium]|nr:hypothetical protein [Candidatus Dependentiae bacterium]